MACHTKDFKVNALMAATGVGCIIKLQRRHPSRRKENLAISHNISQRQFPPTLRL
eukprot:m.799522 g.799522  ORF g.799522 m.799522 type:complete len:55 (-) comp23353_c0_seq4:4266-4430(-)